ACGKVCAEQVTHIDAEDNREKESDRPACRTATLGDHREQGTEDLKRASGKNSGTPQGKQRRQFVDVEVRPGEVEQPGYGKEAREGIAIEFTCGLGSREPGKYALKGHKAQSYNVWQNSASLDVTLFIP